MTLARSWTSLLLWLGIEAFVLGCLTLGTARLAAQTAEPSRIEAMRVFVPEEYVDRVVTAAYLTVPIEVLDKLLKDQAERQSLVSSEKVGIQRAIYVARWNEQELSSRASLWQVGKADTQSVLNIGKLSVAVEEPQGIPGQPVSLSKQLRYVNENRLQILVDQQPADQPADLWFGFKAQPKLRDIEQQTIDLQLPRAVVGTLLIAAPSHIVVTADLPCVAVSDIQKFLPEQWPASAIPSLAADEQWYAVWLSGQEACTLNFSPIAKVKDAGYSMLIANAQSDSQVTPAGLQVSSQFRLSTIPQSGKLRLQIEDPLHVRSISIGGVEVANWKTIDDPVPIGAATDATRKPTRLIECECKAPEEGLAVVSVDCIGRIPLPFDGQLPRIEIEGAYVLDGRCTLRGRDRVQIEDVHSSAHLLATNNQGEVPQWQWQWTGKSPVTSARMRVMPSQWSIRSLTRLDVQADVIVASVHANISSLNVQGNQVTLKLAAGWFVDSWDLENAPIGVTANINDAAGDASELNIRWDERRTDIDARVILKAHYHQSTETENLRLNSTRILSLPGADQQDAYIIESSGRFRLELDAELLRLRARDDELLPWQQAHLPRIADAWIFRSGHAALPPIRLTRTRATLEARLHTTVEESLGQLTARYDVLCKPISGSIKQLKIQMTLPANAVAPTWTVVEPFGQNSAKKVTASSSAVSSSAGETTFTIDLSEDMSEQFQLQTELSLGRREPNKDEPTGEISVPLPRMRQAVSQEAVLVVPAAYKFSDAFAGIEILPRGMCCDGGQLIGASPSTEVIAARYDASAFAKVELKPQPVVQQNGWAHSQLHEHWQYRAGRAYHRSTWDIANPTSQSLELTIPADWEFQTLLVNNLEHSLTSSTATSSHRQHLVASIPKGSHVRVQLICSHNQAARWFEPVTYDQPELSLPVLQSRVAVWFPKHRWAMVGLPQVAGTWADRFCPQRWWQLLTMQPGPLPATTNHSSSANSNSDIFPEFELQNQPFVASGNWWSLDFQDPDEVIRIWSIDQAWVGTACLCLFLIVCLAISVLCGSHWQRWLCGWIVTGIALAVVPVTWLICVQLVALAMSAATVVRLAHATITQSRASNARRYDSMVTKSLLPKSSALSLWLSLCVLGTPTVLAQPFKEGVKPKREVYGILIPVNRQNEVTGEFAYVSPRLFSLLRNTSERRNEPSEVRIASVIYSISINNDLVGLTNTLGDIQVELNVQATAAEAELLLPFQRSEVTVVRASLDSQSLILGDRIRQESEQVTWRASDNDTHVLRLTLRPRSISQREGRGFLSMAIPAIPVARLEIQSESISDWRDIQVDSIGSVQSESFRTFSARLGPVNRLNVNWPLSMNRNGPSQVQSDTWVHTRGDKIMAMCQLRMRGGSSLQGSLAVVGDANWIPVGQTWEDFRFVANEGTSATGRPIYLVEKLKDRTGDELSLKVLMLPRDEATAALSIPFLALQQPLTAASRTLALSHTDAPLWKMAGADWPALLASQASQIWNGTRLGEQPSLWKVPVGSVQNTLQRISPPAQPTVSEVSELQLQLPETKTKYVARWSSPLVGQPTVRFHIPNGLRLESVLVDALTARYSIQKIPDSSSVSELVVFVDSSLNGLQSIHLQFSSPTRLNRGFRLARPVLLASEIRSSIVQVYQGVELASTHTMVDESALELESFDVRDDLLLQQLQLPLGRIELGNRYREKPELPIEFTLTRANPTRNGRALLRFTRNDQGWRAHLDAVVDVKEGQASHVFFEVPRSLEGSLREPIESSGAITLWPLPDSNRTLLAVLPARDAADQVHISLSFKLPTAGASQAINIPEIRLPALSLPRPAVALPNSLAGEPVRWSGAGRSLPASWLQALAKAQLDLTGFDLFEPVDSQSQATWQPREQREMDIELFMTSIALDEPLDVLTGHRRGTVGQPMSTGKRNHVSGSVTYWLEPHNHPHVDLQVPATCTLVGVETNDGPSQWQRLSGDQVRILLQPSYLPSRLSLIVRWDDLSSSEPHAQSIALPRLQAAIRGPVFVRGPLGAAPGTPAQTSRIRGFQPLAAEAASATQAQVWADTLISAGPVAAGRGGEELAVWLPHWNPMWLGLEGSSKIKLRRQAISSRTSVAEEDSNEEIQLTVIEFWTEFLNQHGLNSSQVTGASEQGPQDMADAKYGQWPLTQIQNMAEFEWWQWSEPSAAQLDHLMIEMPPGRTDSDSLLRYAVAGIWLLVGIVIWRSGRGSGQRYYVALANMVWPIWLALALAMAALLPIWWPALVAAAGLSIVLVRRYRQLRGDRHFVLKPKSLLYQK